MKELYRAVAGRIRAELSEVATITTRIADIWQQAQVTTDDYYVDATALNLHSFYTGMERILEVIAESIDQTLPQSASWHQDLLRQMTAEIPGVRPAVLSIEARNQLDRYRGFRHVVRNVYAYKLDAAQIAPLVQNLPTALGQVSKELLAFADFLEQLTQD